MALTQQQLDATRKYKAGDITSDQYKQLYVTNYNPAKDPTAGKNMAYSGTSSPEAIRIQENSQALINAMQPKPVVPVQPVPQMVQSQVQQAKQDKIINQNLDPRTGKPLPVDNTQQVWDAAYKKWNAGIPLTQQEMQVIGATTATKPKASSGGSSSGSSSVSTPKQIISYAESQLRGSGGSTAADKLVTLNNAGVMDNLTPSEIKSLMNKFGVDEKMIEQAENRLESITTGITLPSGRVTVPTNPNLLVR